METLKRIMTSPVGVMVVLSVVVGLLAMGCSSTQNGGAEDPTDDTSGGGISDFDDPLNAGRTDYGDPATDDTGGGGSEPEDSGASYGGGTGHLKLKVIQSGSPANGDVRILTADVDPVVVQEGNSDQTFDIKAGRYDIEIQLDTTMDHPTQRLRDVPIKAGETTERDVNFTVGTIILRPMRGRGMVRSKVRWRYAGGGDWFEGTSQTGAELTLSTGRYDAEITLNRTAIVIEDIQVYEGKRTVSPPVQMGGR